MHPPRMRASPAASRPVKEADRVIAYLDANAVIYFVEKHPIWGPKIHSRIARLRAAGDDIAVSDLARLECLVVPFATGNATVLADFDAFFNDPAVRVFPVSAAVFERAARIRAVHRFQALDALHLAAAVQHGCGLFLTNDAPCGDSRIFLSKSLFDREPERPARAAVRPNRPALPGERRPEAGGRHAERVATDRGPTIRRGEHQRSAGRTRPAAGAVGRPAMAADQVAQTDTHRGAEEPPTGAKGCTRQDGRNAMLSGRPTRARR